MPDDIDLLWELCRSVYVTAAQKAALRRVLTALSRGQRASSLAPAPSTVAATGGATEPLRPILGPGDAQ